MSFTFNDTGIPDLKIIEPRVFCDERGFFMETYSKREFTSAGISLEFVQDNHSKSKKGVLRGLHFQTKKVQAKLVRVVKGSVYDVALDLRHGSPTYGKWEGILLSEKNKKQFYIPGGFAHGFLTLEDDTEFLYKCSDFYDNTGEGGIMWNDEHVNIDWGFYREQYDIDEFIISEKDKKNLSFKEYASSPLFIY